MHVQVKNLRISQRDVFYSNWPLGWRCFITFILWLVIGFGISPGNGFFVSLVLYMSPILVDYLRYQPTVKWHFWVRRIELAIMMLYLSIGIIGLIGIIDIQIIDGVLHCKIVDSFIVLKSYSVPLYLVWISIVIVVAFTLFDWIAYKTEHEEKLIKSVMKSV